MQHPDRLRRPHPGVHQAQVDARLDTIKSVIKEMTQIITENSLTLDKIEERIAIMQEKIDGIN